MASIYFSLLFETRKDDFYHMKGEQLRHIMQCPFFSCAVKTLFLSESEPSGKKGTYRIIEDYWNGDLWEVKDHNPKEFE